ncbi:Wall-associated receptor kinase 2 [Ananas comosus]|uniref:Wall-associated receptor kinase 2 n=1 Tax=Ananas comosus TaxID=4615 RepID=A0A199VZX7_ANACO|nr:Wall-associated receptor kinase 2 [Ananas comosus]
METKENSISTGIVILWELFLFQLLAMQLTSASVALRGCPERCGNVEIPYPFGIGRNCSMEGFTLNCTLSNGSHKPFVNNIEFLSISLSSGIARIANNVSSQCYNAKNGNVTNKDYWLSLGTSPYRFSSTLNKFTTIGCMTLALLIVNETANSTANSYWSGCVSMCRRREDLSNGSCTGIGCCQTSIPKGIVYSRVWFDKYLNSSETYNFSRCGYAALVEEGAFNFSTSYITTSELYGGRLPLVLDWAVRNKNCTEARQNMTSYACVSEHSTCVDSANGPGYLCNCSKGYQGNPYLPHGCQDIDECANKDVRPCSGSRVCNNTQGSYQCLCPPGTYGDSSYNGTCYPSQKHPRAVKLVVGTDSTINSFICLCCLCYYIVDLMLLIYIHAGICIGLLIILIIMLCIHIILERRKLIKVKEENFQEHGGWLLLEEIEKRQGLAFKMFTKEELEQATNKFHKNNIIGHGSYGTVYKGILKDNRVVAIKKANIINERQKKEFGKEMLILSQINHKNIVKLLGCCLEVEVPMLVYEYISNGTLFQLIHGNSRRIYISLETRLKIALESAEALVYLHSSASPPIIHGDVKSANILLDDHLMAKVSDFGASMLTPWDETQFVTLVQGTCGYLDPEYLQTCQLIDKSDVYSFGVVLLELLTGRKALRFEGTAIEMNLSSTFLSSMKEGRFNKLLDEQIKYDEEVERINEIAALAKACLNVKGDDRPSMKEVAEELDKLRKMKQHPWEQHKHAEIESLLSNPSSYREEENTGFYSLEKKAMLSIEPGR